MKLHKTEDIIIFFIVIQIWFPLQDLDLAFKRYLFIYLENAQIKREF